MQINSRVIQAHPSGPPKASTIYILIPSSHCLEHLWPSPLKKILISCPLVPGWFQKVPVYPLLQPMRSASPHRAQSAAKTLILTGDRSSSLPLWAPSLQAILFLIFCG